MKKFIGIISTLLACGSFAMAEIDMVAVAKIDAVTNAAATASGRATVQNVSGMLEYIVIDLSVAASPDVDIDIKTVGSTGSGASRTLFSADDITADVGAPVRNAAVTTANAVLSVSNSVAKIPLMNETIQVDVYDSNTNTVDANVYIYTSK